LKKIPLNIPLKYGNESDFTVLYIFTILYKIGGFMIKLVGKTFPYLSVKGTAVIFDGILKVGLEDTTHPHAMDKSYRCTVVAHKVNLLGTGFIVLTEAQIRKYMVNF